MAAMHSGGLHVTAEGSYMAAFSGGLHVTAEGDIVSIDHLRKIRKNKVQKII
ncbi:hypothetical protein AT3G44704 [Arabidopsis thaliana]|uniref:Uncharacterized protein n=1 Tax=Arabidopsis thaliana TaxID=3702 RepID=B3H748_ARATH|nr:uncharacterized protein AT3G44704 [Arabidopsis thaliana]AEE77933.1 hypothetical protein AT3G44704 [Arabidopsis thaliana]|eukprot:NP_001118773.1 hypothetical protein AT3G44704 [Arabidopsis thaliana]